MTKARPGTGLWARPNMRDYHVRGPLGSGFYFEDFGGGGSPVIVVYPSTDYAIVSGAPNEGTALDYVSFVDSDIAEDGTRYLVYREGQNHNSTSADSSIIFRKRPLGSALGSPVTIATGDASTNVTNPSLGVTQTGRVIVFYEKAVGTPTQRTEYFKYSDDDGDTWSSEILFSSEQESGQPYFEKQLGGPGKAIKYNGYMLKPMFGTTTPGVGGRLGRLYKSVDDGETWTFVANIWPSSNDDGEEPTLVALPTGRLIATQRSDTVNETRLLYSDDEGLTWSDPISISFPSVGKSPIEVSGDTLLIMGRWHGMNGQPIYSYTTNTDGISGWSTVQPVSGRTTTWMYGGIVVWDGSFIANWAQGVPGEGTPGVSGPTIIYEKEFIPSTTYIAPPPVYTEEYQLILDYPQGRGATVPTDLATRSLQNQLVEYLIDDGIWDEEIEVIYFFEHNDSALAEFSLYNWKKPWDYIATAIGAPAYGVTGYSFNGTDEYIDLNWDGSNKLIYTQNDASAFVFINADTPSGGRAIGASNANANTQTRGPHIIPRSAGDAAVWQINDDTGSTVASTDGTGFWMAQRRSSTDKRLRHNDAEIAAVSITSVVPTAVDLGVGATIFNNGPGSYRACTISILGTGGAMVGLEELFYDRLLWYKTEVAAL